jgi:hypothetical protein
MINNSANNSKNKENRSFKINNPITSSQNFNQNLNCNQNLTTSVKKLKLDQDGDNNLQNNNNTSSQILLKNEFISKLAEIKENLKSDAEASNFKYFSKNYLSIVFEAIREGIYYNLDLISETLPLIESITEILLLIKFDDISNPSMIFDIFNLIESLTYIYLFHFHIEITSQGFKLLNLLLSELDFDFHKETLQKMIKILHILKAKKTVNALVCSKIISTISQGILLIIQLTNQETRKILLDFVTLNSEDFVLMWILCSACQGEMNFSKFFAVDAVSQLIEKASKDFEKYNRALEMAINSMKSEKSLAVKNKIKQSIDVIGCISKLIDSFNIQGNKTYNYDKIIKNNLVPVVKKFWTSILFIQDSFFFVIIRFNINLI